MKLRRLDLAAFGPFTDVSLDFTQDSSDLHLIYGPNEAGKSAALRALIQALFGIPHISSDDFIHPYSRMRIGAELEKQNKDRLAFVRLKGKTNTIRTPDEAEPLDPALLNDFLGGITEDRFVRMFGIDHAGLIRGGEEIIQGGGEMGRILFAGGSGISNLKAVQEELIAEAAALFRPSAQKPEINAALADLKSVRQEMRDVQLSAAEWSDHAAALDAAKAEKEMLTVRLSEKQREKNRLERVQKALPLMGRRQELTTALAGWADAPLLAEDFPERRRDVQTALRTAQSERDSAEKTLAEIRDALDSLTVDQAVLAAAETIETLYQELGSVRKAEKDRRRLMGMKSGEEAEAKNLLKGLKPRMTLEEAGDMRLDKAESVRIQELGAVMERLKTRAENGREEAAKLQLRIKRLQQQINDMGDSPNPAPLKAALEAARAESLLPETCQAEAAALEREWSNAAARFKRLGAPGKSLETINDLPLPELESIDIFEARMADASEAVKREKTAVTEARNVLSEIDRDFKQLEMEGGVPSETDLSSAREDRDARWAAIRKLWLDGVEIADPEADAQGLAGIYETKVRDADTLSDRLRREADRVARKATLQADWNTRTKALETLEQSLAAAQAAQSNHQAEWEALWAPSSIVPRTPREMRPWLQNTARLMETAAALQEREAKLSDLKARISSHEQALVNSLTNADQPCKDAMHCVSTSTLDKLLPLAAARVAALEKQHTNHDAALRDLRDREAELQEINLKTEKAQADLETWRSEWARAVAPLGLDEDASPAQANAVIEDIRSLMVKLKDIDVFRKRIKGIDRDAAEFADKTAALADKTAPDLSGKDPDEIIKTLNQRLSNARQAAAEQKSLNSRLAKEEQRFRKSADRIAVVQAQLTALCQEAGCPDPETLPEAEKQSQQRRDLQKELTTVEDRLRELSGGSPIDSFLEAAATVDPDAIDPRVRQLEDAIKDLETRKSELDQTIGRETSELKRMDGGGRAADLAVEAEGILAGIRSRAEHYIQLKLASATLNSAIERYREKRQGPILRRAEALFSRMTIKSFEGLRLEFTDKGETILVGVRPGGKDTVGVGGMSEGTADQLYLAVRLASLETFLENHEPMPFIVDDILIQFDDQRAAATLEALAELSEKTQVIIFTHHRHLLDVAKGCLGDNGMWVHCLRNAKGKAQNGK